MINSPFTNRWYEVRGSVSFCVALTDTYLKTFFFSAGVNDLILNAQTWFDWFTCLCDRSVSSLETILSAAETVCHRTDEWVNCLVVYCSYDDTLVVPIIENTPEEKDLKTRMAQAMEEYPDSCAVLVRRHGVYVWGESWEKAKTMWVFPNPK